MTIWAMPIGRRALVLGPEGDEGPKIEGKIANGLAGQPVVETRR